MAVDDLDSAVDSSDYDRVWYSIQAFLVAVGNISKLFWPTKSKNDNRGKKLRESSGVDEDLILKSRTVRNHFEHFDERLERWATSSNWRVFIDSNIAPINFISGIDESYYLRNYDPVEKTISYQGVKYNLLSIVKEIHVLFNKLNSHMT